MPPPASVLIDIEGTTTPIAFVHRVLFPHARAALPALVTERARDPAVAGALAEVRRLAPGCDPLARLLAWMDEDAKITPLKTLQGIAWRDGYKDGLLKGDLYPDVAPTLRRWHAAGLRLDVYSSGSEEAQRLIFAHSTDGDLSLLFSGFHDTRIGGKREPASYAAIARSIGVQPPEILFLSDIEAELDAAADAGLRTCQLVRAQDSTSACATHPTAADFDAVAARFGLPAPAALDNAAAPASPWP